MLSIKEQLQENIIDVSFSGDISKEEYKKVNSVIEKHQQKYGNINMLIEVKDFQWNSAEAMLKDFKLSIDYFLDFNKLAIVTDKQWLAISTEVIDELLPSIEMEIFDFKEKPKATSWLTAN